MTTALGLAEEALAATIDAAEAAGIELPEIRYVQMGDPVIACPSVIAAVTAINTFTDPNVPPGALPGCAPIQVATVSVYVAHEYTCARDDGTDDPEAVYKISQVMAAEGNVVWDALNALQFFMGPDNVAVNWTINGGFCYVIGTCTRGIL